MSTAPKRLGFAAVVTLVALRFLIGFHFFSEGASKLRDPKPFSGYFFGAAKGPLAPLYRSQIWDADGLWRLNYAENSDGSPATNTRPAEDAWDAHRTRAISYYQFDDKQQARSAKVVEKFKRLVRDFDRDYQPDIIEYFHGVRRRDRNLADGAMQGVESLYGQTQKWDKELKSKGAPLISTADALWDAYELAIFDVASADQKQRGLLRIQRPGRRFMDSVMVDSLIPYFDATIGILLMFGLFTRPAAIIAAAFLASVIGSQFPGASGAAPTWPQAIEMIALLHLAAIAAGRYAGLDGVLAMMFARRKTERK